MADDLERKYDVLSKEFKVLKNRVSKLERKVAEFDDEEPEEEPETDPIKERDPIKDRDPIRAAPVAAKRSKETSKPIENLGFKIFGGVGFLLILLGIFYFYRYAVEQGWIGYGARVFLGVIFAAAIMYGGHVMLNRKYVKYGMLVVGGGAAMLYFVVYMTYHSVPYRNALGITLSANILLLFFVVLLTAALALKHDSLILTSYAFLLGYITSFIAQGTHQMMLSTILLSVALMYLILKREWDIELYPVISMYFLYLIYAIRSDVFTSRGDPVVAIVYLAILFGLANGFVKFLGEDKKRIFITLIGAVITLGCGLGIMNTHWSELDYLLPLVLTVLYGILAWASQDDEQQKLLFRVISVVMLTVVIALYFEHTWLTIAWAVEGMLLIAVGSNKGYAIFRQLGYAALGLATANSFLVDASRGYPDRTISFGFIIVSLLVSAYYLSRIQLQEGEKLASFTWGTIATGFVTYALGLEILDKSGILSAWSTDSRMVLLSVLYICIAVSVLFFGMRRESRGIRILSYILIGIVLIKYFVDIATLGTTHRVFTSLLLILVLWLFSKMVVRGSDEEQQLAPIINAGIVILAAIATAIEVMDRAGILTSFSKNARQVTLSIVWALEAVGALIWGYASKQQALRKIGTILFAIVIVKILIVDLGSLETIYRVLVTIIVGLIALGGAFVFVKNKEKIERFLQG